MNRTLLREAYISTRLALLANFKVLWVSSILLDAGVTVQISWNFHVTHNINMVQWCSCSILTYFVQIHQLQWIKRKERVSKDHALFKESIAINWGSNWNCHANLES